MPWITSCVLVHKEILNVILAAKFFFKQTFCAILVEGIIWNIYVKLFWVWACGYGDGVI